MEKPVSDIKNFEHLAFLYSKYLNHYQRETALMAAGVLHQHPRQALRQEQEDCCVAAVRRRGKEFEFWDAVMRYVPLEHRAANPFLKRECVLSSPRPRHSQVALVAALLSIR